MPDIGLSQKVALLEAYGATVSPRTELPVIGGASLVILGSKLKTEYVEFAVTAAALFVFEKAT
ncbi:MAG: hypothetical protein MMC33_006222 [Icmadophila ericetorum]|nr:hypothetical protein [Icmadophila ericetorum]